MPCCCSPCSETRGEFLSSLTGLLRTNESNDTTQLCALSSRFSDDLLIHALLFRQVCCALEHAVLECEHLLKCVVKERCTEADIVSGVEAHFELARALLLGRLFQDLSILLWLWSVISVSAKTQMLFGSCEHTSRRM